jgi:hypothetical protein
MMRQARHHSEDNWRNLTEQIRRSDQLQKEHRRAYRGILRLDIAGTGAQTKVLAREDQGGAGGVNPSLKAFRGSFQKAPSVFFRPHKDNSRPNGPLQYLDLQLSIPGKEQGGGASYFLSSSFS